MDQCAIVTEYGRLPCPTLPAVFHARADGREDARHREQVGRCERSGRILRNNFLICEHARAVVAGVTSECVVRLISEVECGCVHSKDALYALLVVDCDERHGEAAEVATVDSSGVLALEKS